MRLALPFFNEKTHNQMNKNYSSSSSSSIGIIRVATTPYPWGRYRPFWRPGDEPKSYGWMHMPISTHP